MYPIQFNIIEQLLYYIVVLILYYYNNIDKKAFIGLLWKHETNFFLIWLFNVSQFNSITYHTEQRRIFFFFGGGGLRASKFLCLIALYHWAKSGGRRIIVSRAVQSR